MRVKLLYNVLHCTMKHALSMKHIYLSIGLYFSKRTMRVWNLIKISND